MDLILSNKAAAYPPPPPALTPVAQKVSLMGWGALLDVCAHTHAHLCTVGSLSCHHRHKAEALTNSKCPPELNKVPLLPEVNPRNIQHPPRGPPAPSLLLLRGPADSCPASQGTHSPP